MSAATQHARAACPPPPVLQGSGFYIGRVTPLDHYGLNSSIAIDGQGRFVIAYETPPVAVGSGRVRNDIVAMRFDASGACLDCGACPAPLTSSAVLGNWKHVSLDMTPGSPADSTVTAAFVGEPTFNTTLNTQRLFQSNFSFSAFSPIPVTAINQGWNADAFPSLGVNSAGVPLTSWTRRTGMPEGLVYRPDALGIFGIAPCDDFCEDSRWQPCVAVSSVGRVSRPDDSRDAIVSGLLTRPNVMKRQSPFVRCGVQSRRCFTPERRLP